MSKPSTVQLDLGLLLPSVESEADPCLDRLLSMLDGREGVERVHVTREDGAARLCVHFDPDRLSVSRVEALAKAAGLGLEAEYTHLDLPLPSVTHERAARALATRATAIEGVLFASASASSKRMHLELEPGADRSRIDRELAALGVATVARPRGGEPHHGHDHGAEEHGEHGEHEPGAHEHEDHGTEDHGTEDHGTGDHGADEHASGEHEHGDGDGHGHGGGGHAHGGSNLELGFAIAGGVFTLAGWIVESYVPGVTIWVSRVLLYAAYFFGGFFALREMYEALRAKRLEIDFLMLVAAGGAAALGEWAEGGLLLFLFGLGHALEAYAMGRARRAIEALSELAPKVATVLRSDGTEAEVPVEELALGDRVLIRPNSRVPADGYVTRGESAVNQAPITGESMPVDKRPAEDPERITPESRLFAGTINGSSALEAIVTKLSADSTLARVVTMVREAQTQQSPTQRFTDRFERIFVPAVLGLVVLCLFAWLVIDEPFSASFYRAMAVLVAASPCALAIATPSAVLSGVARAARGGVLIKGGAHLESLGAVEVIAFDKTGTLTQGEPKLTDVAVADGVERADLLRIALAVERRSDHPLAEAVVRAAEEELVHDADALQLDAESVSAITGFGVRALVDGEEAHLGKLALFVDRLELTLPEDVAASAERLAAAGRTTIIVAHGGRFLGVLGLMDPPRESAASTLEALHALGVERLMMLTGDHQRAADGIAAEVGLDDARGDLLPEDKVAAISEFVARGELVAMIGDGVNDAPAMAKATVGVAMGAGGSDVALETADVALMADDLTKLPFAVGLSRASRRIIRQNLWASLGMVAFLIPATLFGIAGIGIAVLLHEGSTLVVVANALRLLAHPDPTDAG